MFAHSDKSSAATVASSPNKPGENGAFKLDENKCGDIENILDHLLRKDDSAKVDVQKKKDRGSSDLYKKQNNKIKCDDEYYSDTSDDWTDWTDESDSEIEYPPGCLSSLNQHPQNGTETKGTKIIDLPQFIIVFTAFKAEDTVIIPPNDLLPEYINVESEFPPKESLKVQLSDARLKKREIIKKHKALINKKSQQNEGTRKTDESFTAPRNVHRIKYVRYSSAVDVLQREREIQVSANECITNEVAVQCDLDEEGNTEDTKEDSPQLNWFNHILEAHVLNDDGNIYECHICGEIAFSYASKERHSLIHKDNSLLCYQCGLHFRTVDKLESHEQTKHQGNAFQIKKALRCPKLYCTKAFHSKKQLFKHIDGHAKKTEQRCSKCQRSFYSLFQYHMHKSKRNCWR